MLEISHLSKRYNGITAVDDVNFAIRPGEILGYVGPNGAGKSTTVKMIIGLLEPSEGCIRWNGRSIIEDLRAEQESIAAKCRSMPGASAPIVDRWSWEARCRYQRR